jgi:hypothetical protein
LKVEYTCPIMALVFSISPVLLAIHSIIVS